MKPKPAKQQKHRGATDVAVKTMVSSQWFSLVRLWLLIACLGAFSSSLAAEETTAWMTDSGYDTISGTNAICWKVRVNNTSLRPGFNVAGDTQDEERLTNDEFASLQDELYTGKSGPALLLPSCTAGMNLTVFPVAENEDNNGELLANTAYTYRFIYSVVPSNVIRNASDPTALTALVPPNTIWLRIVLCDVLRVGFCNPFINSTNSDGEDAPVNVALLESQVPVQVPESDEGVNSTTMITGKSLGEAHIVSEFIEAAIADDGSGMLSGSTDIYFRVPPEYHGVYFAIGHAVMFFGPAGNSSVVDLQIDMADALPSRIYKYSLPPMIETITDQFKIALGVALGLVCSFQLYLFGFILRHRDNSVMKIAQAPFLASLAFFACIASASCAFYMPIYDIFCNIWSPMVLIPLTLIGSILVGRLWRVHCLLSVSHRISLMGSRRNKPGEETIIRTLSVLADWQMHCCPCRTVTPRRRSSLAEATLRKKVKDMQLVQLIATLTIPQIIVQVIDLTLTRSKVDLDMNEAGTFGVTVCSGRMAWPTIIAIALTALLYFLAVYVAWISSDLPSVFNETKSIFTSAWIDLLVLLIGGTMLLVTNVETTSPNTRAFIWTLMTLSLTLSTCWFVVLPKVNRVRSGETVVLSNLFAANQRRHSFASVSGPSRRSSTEELCASVRDRIMADPELAAAAASYDDEEEDGEENHHIEERRTATNASPKRTPIVIKRSRPPPRNLELQLLALKELISEVSSSSSEGRQIFRHEWELLRFQADALSSQLERLEFTWTSEEEDLTQEFRDRREAIVALVSARDCGSAPHDEVESAPGSTGAS